MAACAAPPVITGCEAGDDLVPLCGLRNPEDLLPLPGGDWILLSQMRSPDGDPGSLAGLRVGPDRVSPLWPPPADAPSLDSREATPGWGDPACPGPPRPQDFAPHGIDLHAPALRPPRLLVVNHAREAVELFEVGTALGRPALGWRGCVPLGAPGLLNDVAALPDAGFVVTRMLPGAGGLRLAWGGVRLLLGLPTGVALEWRPDAGWRELPGSAAAAPNGIAVSPDGARVYVAAWGDQELFVVAREGEPARRSVPVEMRGDNLSWTPDGRLLLTGQLGGVFQISACGRVREGTCAVPFRVVAIDPETLALETRLDHPGDATMGMGTAAIEHAGRLWVGTAMGDRIAHRPLAGR